MTDTNGKITCFSILLRIELVFGAPARYLHRVDPPFQYPLADRVGFWGSQDAARAGTALRFSILLRIELVFGVRPAGRSPRPHLVSVSSCGSSWFLGALRQAKEAAQGLFQYPLADRVGFWGGAFALHRRRAGQFQYPLADRVGFWGYSPKPTRRCWLCVSVSSCGSSWFLGRISTSPSASAIKFQYPLADRVGFWGLAASRTPGGVCGFSILLRIELVFGDDSTQGSPEQWARFSILLRIELVFGGSELYHRLLYLSSFSILLRIELVFGASTVVQVTQLALKFQYPLADRVGFWG